MSEQNVGPQHHLCRHRWWRSQWSRQYNTWCALSAEFVDTCLYVPLLISVVWVSKSSSCRPRARFHQPSISADHSQCFHQLSSLADHGKWNEEWKNISPGSVSPGNGVLSIGKWAECYSWPACSTCKSWLAVAQWQNQNCWLPTDFHPSAKHTHTHFHKKTNLFTYFA